MLLVRRCGGMALCELAGRWDLQHGRVLANVRATHLGPPGLGRSKRAIGCATGGRVRAAGALTGHVKTAGGERLKSPGEPWPAVARIIQELSENTGG